MKERETSQLTGELQQRMATNVRFGDHDLEDETGRLYFERVRFKKK